MKWGDGFLTFVAIVYVSIQAWPEHHIAVVVAWIFAFIFNILEVFVKKES